MSEKWWLGGGIMEGSKHFSLDEFRCRHCGQVKLDERLLVLLERVRSYVSEKVGEEVPIIISSGYRCEEHNKMIKNSSPDSKHCLGQAADIFQRKISNQMFYAYIKEAFTMGILPGLGGLGKYKNYVS